MCQFLIVTKIAGEPRGDEKGGGSWNCTPIVKCLYSGKTGICGGAQRIWEADYFYNNNYYYCVGLCFPELDAARVAASFPIVIVLYCIDCIGRRIYLNLFKSTQSAAGVKCEACHTRTVKVWLMRYIMCTERLMSWRRRMEGGGEKWIGGKGGGGLYAVSDRAARVLSPLTR